MNSNVVVRPASIDDAEGIARVRMLTWQSAYGGIMPEDYLTGMDLADQVQRTRRFWPKDSVPSHWVAVSTDEDEIVGWTCISHQGQDPDLSGSVGEVAACYTLPRFWGQGVGYQMMEAVLNHFMEQGIEAVVLWVLEDNQRARSFYERQGFLPDGSTKEVNFIPGASLTSMRLHRSL